jgi:hypothetical protein
MQPKQSSNPIGGIMRGLATGMLGPEKIGAIDQRHDQKKAETLKKGIATLQQIRQLPVERRIALVPQISQAIGRPVPESMMSDQEIDTQLAMMMGEAGLSPERPAFQGVNLGGGAYGSFNPNETDPTKALTVIRQPDAEPVKPQDLPEGMWYGPDGKGPPQPIPGYVGMRTSIAQGSQNAGGSKKTINLTPAEVEARGYPKGTVVQRDEEGNEMVRSRPSTAQTGQPTESERSAGLHAAISLNGLGNIMRMEGGGYDRANLVNQMGGGVGGERERLYDQAADEFVDGYLRAMTGAAATKQEIETYKKQWFPVLGDNAKVIEQKSVGRLNALRGMKRKAGRAWDPSWDSVITDLEQKFGGATSGGPPQAPTGAAGAAGRGVSSLAAMAGGDIEARIDAALAEDLNDEDEGAGGLSDEERAELEELRRELSQ